MPVIQTQGKTQQVANTHVQHVVNTVEVEKPKIVKQTVQKPVINEKINQVTKHPEVPQVQVFEKTVEIPQLQAVEKIVETRETQMIQSFQTSESLNNDPDAEIKLLAEELHGVGGFVFDAHQRIGRTELRRGF